MLGLENLAVFVSSVVVFTMTPGLNSIFIVNQSISRGRVAGIFTAFGVTAGLITHTLLGALGLSAVVTQSEWIFYGVKYLGAAYLLYLGIKCFLAKEGKIKFAEGGKVEEESRWVSFRSGMISNLLNPEVALFFLAFFPGFIQKEHLASPIPFMALGVLLTLIGVVWLTFLAYFSSLFVSSFTKNPKWNLYLNKISGFVFVLLAIMVAMPE